MEELKVLALGTPVKIDGRIDGEIRGVRIVTGLRVLYLVVWWNGETRYEEWLWPDEIRFVRATSNAIRIGFGAEA